MKFFRFMALPLELRENIYKYCLVVPGNIVHYPDYYSYDKILGYKDAKLTDFLSLLFLSKQIHEEAAAIFYAKNSFRITATAMDLKTGRMVDSSVYWSWYDSQDWDEPYHIDTVWVRKGHLIRHATVCFDRQDLNPQEVTLKIQEAHESQLLTEAAGRDVIHDWNLDTMFEVWRFKGAALSHLRNLATLDIDIKRLYCPMGCCRDGMVYSLWDVLTDFLDTLSPDLIIRIHGARGKTEDNSAVEWYLAMQKAMRRYKAEKEKEAKAELEKAEAELEEADAKLLETEAKLEKADAKQEEAEAEQEEAEAEREEAEAEREEAEAQLKRVKAKMEKAIT